MLEHPMIILPPQSHECCPLTSDLHHQPCRFQTSFYPLKINIKTVACSANIYSPCRRQAWQPSMIENAIIESSHALA